MYSVTIVWSAFAFIHLRLVPQDTPHPAHVSTPPPPHGAVERPAIF